MEKIKNSRAASFITLALIYILAAAVGILVYRALPYDDLINLCAADVAATVFTFVFSVIFKNASVYDPYWSVQPIVILYAYLFTGSTGGAGVLMLIAVTLWGVRLTANWAYTFHGLNHQDWRYTMLHDKTGNAYPLINFIGIHMVPTLIVYACSIPAVYVLRSGVSANFGSVVFFCVSIGAVVLQGSADYQMHQFRRKRTGGLIRVGLWKYSRHPNYLGEILMWWGVGLGAACLFPSEWYLMLAGAALNTVLFLTVSIPMADGRQSHKDGFDAYKRETRMLLPIPKHADGEEAQEA